MAKISEVALLSLSPSPTEVLTLLGDSGTEGEGLNRKRGRGAPEGWTLTPAHLG